MNYIKNLISVIIPVYKVEEYLQEAVDSVFAQIYDNLEIILVDDGSPDNCGKICDDLALKDSRVRVIHKQNGGLSSARNAGLDLARGEFVAFLDSDDIISCDMYADMINAMNLYHPDIVCSNIMTYINKCQEYPNGIGSPILQDGFIDVKQYRIDTLTYKLESASWNKLYRRDLFNKVRFKEGRLNEDYLFIYFLGKQLTSVYYLSKYHYRYRLRQEGICRSGQVIGHFEKNIEDIKADLKSSPDPFSRILEAALDSYLFDRYQINVFKAYEESRDQSVKNYYRTNLLRYERQLPRKTFKMRFYFYIMKYYPSLLKLKKHLK